MVRMQYWFSHYTGCAVDPVVQLCPQDKLMNEVAASVSGGAVTDEDDDDVIMTQEEVGMKCPYTQQVMKFPMRNKICGHNYERDAIKEFILRKKGNAK